MPTKDNHDIQKKINSEFWEPYYSQTKIASGICRQLAFAEGGICWVLINQGKPPPPETYFTLKLLILFFVFDFFQYLVAIIIYYCTGKCYERHIESYNKPSEVIRSGWMNLPSVGFFICKVIALGFASYYIAFKLLSPQFGC